jgi:hypothetical protein
MDVVVPRGKRKRRAKRGEGGAPLGLLGRKHPAMAFVLLFELLA